MPNGRRREKNEKRKAEERKKEAEIDAKLRSVLFELGEAQKQVKAEEDKAAELAEKIKKVQEERAEQLRQKREREEAVHREAGRDGDGESGGTTGEPEDEEKRLERMDSELGRKRRELEELTAKVEQLEEHVRAPEYDAGPKGQMLIQQYIQPAEPFITRVELVGDRFLFAMRSATSGSLQQLVIILGRFATES